MGTQLEHLQAQLHKKQLQIRTPNIYQMKCTKSELSYVLPTTWQYHTVPKCHKHNLEQFRTNHRFKTIQLFVKTLRILHISVKL